MGAEKFLNIKCRYSGLQPDCVGIPRMSLDLSRSPFRFSDITDDSLISSNLEIFSVETRETLSHTISISFLFLTFLLLVLVTTHRALKYNGGGPEVNPGFSNDFVFFRNLIRGPLLE